MTNKKLYVKRCFLNPKSGLAAVDAEVNLRETKTDISVDASLGFSDCSNQIYLDFDVWSSGRTDRIMRERRRKVEHVRTIVNNFLDAVSAAYDELEAKAPSKKKKVRTKRAS